MAEWEKVLQALEHCDLCSDMPNCPGCAYLREPDCMEHLKRDIIALLREQEPVEPLLQTGGNYVCGRCQMYTVGFQHPITGKSVKTWKYCPACGRKVRWE